MLKTITYLFPKSFRDHFETLVLFSRFKVNKDKFLGFVTIINILISFGVSLIFYFFGLSFFITFFITFIFTNLCFFNNFLIMLRLSLIPSNAIFSLISDLDNLTQRISAFIGSPAICSSITFKKISSMFTLCWLTDFLPPPSWRICSRVKSSFF